LAFGSAAAGANASLHAWQVLVSGDDSPIALGYGSPPATVPHTFVSGTYTVYLSVYDDHGATVNRTETLAVS
jgi:hypothetical protein